MEKLKRITLILLIIVAVGCAAAGLSACSKTEEQTPISHTSGTWDKQGEVYLGMVSGKECPAGAIDDEKVMPSIEMTTGEEYYFIIDFNIQPTENNKGGESTDVSIKINPAAAVDATLQETSSGKYEEKITDNVKEIRIKFSIPERKDDIREKRIVLRLKPTVLSEYSIDISFEADLGLAGDLTKSPIQKTVSATYTQGLEYTEIADGGYSVKAVNAKDAISIDIPYFKDGRYVTAIGANAFKDCRALTALTLPDSVTTIGDGAFGYCSALQQIIVPDGVTSIGANAFEGCDSLVYNEYNNAYYLGNTGNPYVVLVRVKNTKIESCSMNAKTRLIYDNAFSGCNQLVSVTITGGIKNIGENAFSGCGKLTEVIIPNGISGIGDSAFKYCTSLAEIIIPDSVAIIGYSAFEGCSSLTDITLGNGVTTIGNGALYSCTSLKEITLPDSVKIIGDSAFGGCVKLVNVTLGEELRSIGSSAFSGCTALTEFTIAENVTYIGGNAFSDCVNLKTIYWNATDCSEAGSYNNYVFTGCGRLATVITGNGVNSIPDYAFYGCEALEELIVDAGLTEIGSYAFYGCGLTLLNVSYGVTAIGDGAFGNCTRLVSVILPDKVESIGERTFSGCEQLVSISIGEGVGSIGDRAFYNCKSLTTVIIPDGVESIGASAFGNCLQLGAVLIGSGVTDIGELAFYGCESIEMVYYKGTQGEWEKLSIGFLNTPLTQTEMWFYSENTPSADGNFWHYVGDKIERW